MFDLPPVRIPHKHAQAVLTEADAIEIWIARWLRHRRSSVVARYGCDPRRIYEVWEGTRHPASRSRAMREFRRRYPELTDRVDFGNHRRIPRDTAKTPAQLSLFADAST